MDLSLILTLILVLIQKAHAVIVSAKIAADDRFELYANSFSYINPSTMCFNCVIDLTFDLPIGDNLVSITAVSMGGPRAFGAVFSIDGQVIASTNTGGSWNISRNATGPFFPHRTPCSAQSQSQYDNILAKPFNKTGFFPSFIWFNGSCTGGSTDDTIWLRTIIRITNDTAPQNSTLVTASIAAANNFELQVGNYYSFSNPYNIQWQSGDRFQFWARQGANDLLIKVKHRGQSGPKGILATFEVGGSIILYTGSAGWTGNATISGIYNNTILFCPRQSGTSTFPWTVQMISIGACNGIFESWYRAVLVVPPRIATAGSSSMTVPVATHSDSTTIIRASITSDTSDESTATMSSSQSPDSASSSQSPPSATSIYSDTPSTFVPRMVSVQTNEPISDPGVLIVIDDPPRSATESSSDVVTQLTDSKTLILIFTLISMILLSILFILIRQDKIAKDQQKLTTLTSSV